MAARPLRLYTLDFPISAEDMGDVHIYPLTPEFAMLWRDLAKQWDRKQGFKTPHGSLGVALSTVTGRMVIMTIRDQEAPDAPLSRRSLIVSDGPLDLGLTRVCFDTWQARHFGTDGERLSQFIDHDNTSVKPLSETLERDEAGYIIGPWWWKKAVGWSVTRKLAPHELVDKTRPRRKVKFVTTTGGTLVAWDYPWMRTTNKGKSNQRNGYAMAYVSVRGETQRASKDPIARIDCHVTRVAPVWNNVKTVNVKHPQFATLLRVPVKHRPVKDAQGRDVTDDAGKLLWATTFKGYTADIVESCGLDPITLPENADGDLDVVRPVFRNKGKHMIGKGPGAYFTLRMASHISRVLGREPVTYTATRYNIPGNSITSGPIPTSKLPAALASSGWKSLRLVILYDDDRTPARICRTLLTDYGIDMPADLCNDETVHDGASLDIAPGITVVMCKAPDIVMHGAHNRTSVIEKIPCLKPAGPDDLIAAICETRWTAGAKIANDAKNPTRRALASKRIVSQFIVATKGVDDIGDDHPVKAAIRDVLKSCGVADNRLSFAVSATPGVAKEAPLTEPVTMVGIHLRRHVYRKAWGTNRRASKLVALITAVHLKPDPESTPYLEMYANGQWRRYADGLTAFHAGEIGNELWGRDSTGAQTVRAYIEQALDNLILPDDTSRVVITADKEDARSIYPALGDNPTLTSPLPGRRLADDGIDVSVVRIALGSHAARPATAYRDSDNIEEMRPSYHMRVLFENNQGSEPTWLLTQASHQHQGANSPLRIGSQMARDDFNEIAISRMSKDMHATSRIEFTVPGKSGAEAGELAVLVARLCDQSLVWDSRTSRPLPLHLPYTADKDHPDYGDHDPGGDAEDDELEVDDE